MELNRAPNEPTDDDDCILWNKTVRSINKWGLSREYEVTVRVGQRSIPNPLLFFCRYGENNKGHKTDPPVGLPHPDDIALTAESKTDPVEKFGIWKYEMADFRLNVIKKDIKCNEDNDDNDTFEDIGDI